MAGQIPSSGSNKVGGFEQILNSLFFLNQNNCGGILYDMFKLQSKN